MKIKLLYILVVIPMFLFTNASFSQATTLAIGDIVIIQNQADTPDDFAFVVLADINEGTGIFFTDCGADASGFASPCNEGAVKYTVPTGGLSAGDIVRFSVNGADFANYSDSRIAGSSGMALAASGDQIIAFQDSSNAAGGTNAGNTPTFLFINHIASTAFTGNPADSNQSALPLGLNATTPPRSALGLGSGTGTQDEWDNSIYTGTYDFSGFSTITEALNAARLSLTDPANYVGVNSIFDMAYSDAEVAMPTELNLTTLSNDEFLSNSFAVYPNPSNGNITVRNSGVALQNITITDLSGRTISSKEMSGVTSNVDLSLKLTTGIYLMKLSTNDASTTKKLIIK
ncbi:T9SS type A sorting domain-containing protein [Kordia sp.]|uniref:T9SS type A sorting domain-containing protein n=1 Tax=Kordia sp. TaxID=1965332 RepID=UPI003B5AFD48